MDDFERKKLKKSYGCKTLNITRVLWIIKKNLEIPLIKYQNSGVPLIISLKIIKVRLIAKKEKEQNKKDKLK